MRYKNTPQQHIVSQQQCYESDELISELIKNYQLNGFHFDQNAIEELKNVTMFYFK